MTRTDKVFLTALLIASTANTFVCAAVYYLLAGDNYPNYWAVFDRPFVMIILSVILSGVSLLPAYIYTRRGRK